MTEKTAIKGVLFACNMNSIRSPMAEAIAQALLGGRVRVNSVGIYEGYRDPFVEEVLGEDALNPPDHDSQDFSAVEPGDYDLFIALTPQAEEAGRMHFAADQIELWDIPNPTDVHGGREALLTAYREARDELKRRITARFSG